MFKHVHYSEVPAEAVTVEGADKVTVRWVISEADGAPNFAMRILEVEPGGHSPLHTHEFEHEVFILEGDCSVWRKGEKDKEFVKTISDGKHSFKKIPLFTFYTNQTGFMEAKPPMFTLAETNLEHWQSYSDHRNILRFIRLGILAVSGCQKRDFDSIVIGPNRLVHLGENVGADMRYVEHKGEAIGAGERDLDRLEARMMFLSLLPAMKKTGDPTATGAALDRQCRGP